MNHLLERALAGLAGAALGAIATAALTLMFWHWSLLLLPPLGAGIGITTRDRGIKALARVVGWM